MSSKTSSTRDRILSATLSLLENGAANTTRMSDIAKAAGVSRQAVYLHYPNRAELLIAAVRHLDEINDIESRLAPSRAALGGAKRLQAWVDVWTGYMPQIYGVAKALIAMQDSDAEARAAWQDRMAAVRHGCAAVITELARDGDLRTDLSTDEATDLLASLLSFHAWEQLCIGAGWTVERFTTVMQSTARRALIGEH